MSRSEAKAQEVEFRVKLILAYLRTGGRTIDDLMRATNYSYNNVNGALRTLRQDNLIVCDMNGKKGTYRLRTEDDVDEEGDLPLRRSGATVTVFRDPLVAALFGSAGSG